MNQRKVIIYQLMPRLFGNMRGINKFNGSIEENGCGKFVDVDETALRSIAELGITHIWYTGIIEHATCTDYSKYGIVRDFPDVVKGNAGSPYAIKDYYDVDPDLAQDVPNRMKEFEELVNRTHKAELKVLIDLVPNHLARQYVSDSAPAGVEDFGVMDHKEVAFSKNNNFYYLPGTEFVSPSRSSERRWVETPARVTGNDCFSATPELTDWYETVKLNYGIDYMGKKQVDFDPPPDTWVKMLDVILHWAKKGVDGFRCDMAGMVPVEFWSWVTGRVRKIFPDLLFIAEIYDADLYHELIFKGGFDYLYDKVVMYDGLRAVMEGKMPASDLTRCWQVTDKIHQHLLYFLENHDEQRLASGFFMGDGEKAIPGMVVIATMFNNPLLIYFGQELGERGMKAEGFSDCDGRTTIYDYQSLELMQQWHSKGDWSGTLLNEPSMRLRTFYKKLLGLMHRKPAFNQGQFYDLGWANQGNSAFNSECLFAFLRVDNHQQFLVVANFGSQDEAYRLRIPDEAMRICGMDVLNFYTGVDLLGFNKNIQFPGEVLVNGGFGGRLNAYSASVYELKASKIE